MRRKDNNLILLMSITPLLFVSLLGCKDNDLHKAVCESPIEDIERIIKNGTDVNARNDDGHTPLHQAAFCGRLDSAKLLVRHGANIHQKANNGWTPLHASAANSRWSNKVAKFLIEKGADIHAITDNGDTPLHLAITGDPNLVKFLISVGADVNARNKTGKTPLHWVMHPHYIKKINKEAVRVLISAGADVLAKDISGNTPLEEALVEAEDIAGLIVSTIDVNMQTESGDTILVYSIRRHNTKLVKILLQQGANPNAKGRFGKTPLFLARWTEQDGIAKLLEEYGANPEPELKPFKMISEEEFIKKLEQLMNEGGGINKGNNIVGAKPLNTATFYGYEDAVKFLIEKGADIEVADLSNRTPLHHAVNNGHLEIASVLIEAGANVRAKADNGFTVIHFAVVSDSNSSELIELLLNNGADINPKAEGLGGLSPLHISVARKDLLLTQFLLEHGADADIKGTNGNTPLHEAVQLDEPEIVEALLNKGANINALNNNNQSPLTIAKEWSQTEILNLFQQYRTKE